MDEQRAKQILKKLNDAIETDGYSKTYVSNQDPSPFCYSTGIYKNFHIPEIFISSLPPNLSSELIDNYLSCFKDKGGVPLNERLDYLIDRFPVYLIEVPNSALAEYVLGSVNFYKDATYRYVQIVYPDTEGNFPNEPGYDYDQEIMSEFKPS